jgi:twitching motility protein PilT
VSFKFDFQIDFEGVNGSLTLQNPLAQLWAFPAMVSESAIKAQGLNLVIGPRQAGKTAALYHILGAVQNRKKVIALYSDMEASNLPIEGNVVSQFSSSQLKQNGVQKSADVVMIDSGNLEFCETAVRLAEEGRSVILTLPFWNVGMGLHRMIDLMEGTMDSRVRRMSSTLQMALGLRLVAGIESPLQGAFELLLVDSEIQQALREMDFAQVSELMRSSAERTGMRSLNQTLFQLLMKRKIELKAAFEASPAPEELDSLLKKVGI